MGRGPAAGTTAGGQGVDHGEHREVGVVDLRRATACREGMGT
jgi:hypothetical protein